MTERNDYSLDIVDTMLRDAGAILTGTTHKASPPISGVVTYLYPHYTFYGQTSDFLTVPSSSSSFKPLPFCALTTRCLFRGRSSLQTKAPLLKYPVTREKQFTPYKKAVIAYLKDPTPSIKTPKSVDLTPLLPPQLPMGNPWQLASP